MGGITSTKLLTSSHAHMTARTANGSGGQFEQWRDGVKNAVECAVRDFVDANCAAELETTGVDIASDVLRQFTTGGKCLRSTFMVLGWRCGTDGDADDESALRASASLELLHAFALLQDDVMDDSAFRRGQPSAHDRFERWHRQHGLPGPSRRFGESAAVLLGDLCLVWAEKMLRGSGISTAALNRVLPRYDEMRTELAVGQFADLVNGARRLPTLEEALDVAARKSGNYTVRRPLELGAAMAGCDERTLWLLGRYGGAVGEAFQLRDDLLDIFGDDSVTGKPIGGDLREHKANGVVVAAHHLADEPTRSQLKELSRADRFDEGDIDRWRALIDASGAVDWIEDMIDNRVSAARELVYRIRIDESVQTALVGMATACTDRAA